MTTSSYSGTGVDALDGGTGTDYAEIDRSNLATAFAFDLSAGRRCRRRRTTARPRSVWRRFLIYGGSEADQITGAAGDDDLRGADGNDT